MKCPNCGFESDLKFCQMCGTKMTKQADQKQPDNNPYINNQSFTEQPNVIPYNNPYQPQNNNTVNTSYAQQPNPFNNFDSIQDNAQNNVNPYTSKSEKNEAFEEINSNPSVPDNSTINANLNINSANPNSVNPQASVSAPNYPNMPYSPIIPQPSKKHSGHKALTIIITSLISVIIIAGIVLSILSSCLQNQSLFSYLKDLSNQVSDTLINDDNYDLINDELIFYKGDVAGFENGTIKFADYKVVPLDSSEYSNEIDYEEQNIVDITLEITNTSDYKYLLTTDQLTLYDNKNTDSFGDRIFGELIAIDGGLYKSAVSLKSGETKKSTFSFTIDNKVKSLLLEFYDTGNIKQTSDYEYMPTESTEYLYFNIDLNK